jgi:hypothetical protein
MEALFVMKKLWTFINQPKLDRFLEVLKEYSITYETCAKSEQKKVTDEVVVSIDERDYEKAKKLLLKQRKRRTSADLS